MLKRKKIVLKKRSLVRKIKDEMATSTEKAFIDHLEELRLVIIKSVAVFLILTALGFMLAPSIIRWLVYPLQHVLAAVGSTISPESILRTLRPTGGFLVGLKAAFLFGIELSLPVILYFFGSFLIPGLTKKERKVIIPAFSASFFLFCIGAAFCYFVILPFALKFFWGYTERLGIRNEWIIENYVSFVVQFLVAFGLVFEIPCIVLALVKVGVLSHAVLRKSRKYAIVGVFVLAAAITPTPDIITQIVVALPMYLLFEFCVWTAKIFERKKTVKDDENTEFGDKDLMG